jgi:hypothetical protein
MDIVGQSRDRLHVRALDLRASSAGAAESAHRGRFVRHADEYAAASIEHCGLKRNFVAYLRTPNNQSKTRILSGTPKSHKIIPGTMVHLLLFSSRLIQPRDDKFCNRHATVHGTT